MFASKVAGACDALHISRGHSECAYLVGFGIFLPNFASFPSMCGNKDPIPILKTGNSKEHVL